METEKELERGLEEEDIERQMRHAPSEPAIETVPHVITIPAQKVGHEKIGKQEAIEHVGGEAAQATAKHPIGTTESLEHMKQLSQDKSKMESEEKSEQQSTGAPGNNKFPSFVEGPTVPETKHEGEEVPLLRKHGQEEGETEGEVERVPGPHKMEFQFKRSPISETDDTTSHEQQTPQAPDIRSLLKHQMSKKKSAPGIPLSASDSTGTGGISPTTGSTSQGQVFEHHHANPTKHTLASQISHHPLSLARRQALKQQHPHVGTLPVEMSEKSQGTHVGGEKTSEIPKPPPVPPKDWVSSKRILQQRQERQKQREAPNKNAVPSPQSPSFIPDPPSSASPPTYAKAPSPHPHTTAVAPATDYEIDVLPPNLRPGGLPSGFGNIPGRSGQDTGTPVRPTSTSTSNTVTGEASKMDMRFQLDVLRMRLIAAQKSRDEVVMRWATHETLRDRNLTLLDQIRHDEVKHQDELIERTKVRDGVVKSEQEAKQKVEEIHAQLMRLERDRAECEARCIGEQQMCAELERRIKDHTHGITHAMALKQKRELEVQDLELKVQLLELEMRRADIFQSDEPPLYHPDYTTRVEIPSDPWTGTGSGEEKLSGSAGVSGANRPVISSQSTVAKESPPSKEEILSSAERHSLPIQHHAPFITKPKLPSIPPASTSSVPSAGYPVVPQGQAQPPLLPQQAPLQNAPTGPMASGAPTMPPSFSGARGIPPQFGVPKQQEMYAQPPPPFSLPVESRHSTPPLPSSSALISPQQQQYAQQQLPHQVTQQQQHFMPGYVPPYIPAGTSGHTSAASYPPVLPTQGQQFYPIAPQRMAQTAPPPLPPRMQPQTEGHDMGVGPGFMGVHPTTASTSSSNKEVPQEPTQQTKEQKETSKVPSPPAPGSVKIPISHRQ